MGSTSTEGVALLVFLSGASCLGTAMLLDGSLVFLLFAVVGMGGSIPLFLKAKARE